MYPMLSNGIGIISNCIQISWRMVQKIVSNVILNGNYHISGGVSDTEHGSIYNTYIYIIIQQCLVSPIDNCYFHICFCISIFTSICDPMFHKFHHCSWFFRTPQVLSSSQGNILEDEAAVQVRSSEAVMDVMEGGFTGNIRGTSWDIHL